jgi:biotin operon repressor
VPDMKSLKDGGYSVFAVAAKGRDTNAKVGLWYPTSGHRKDRR